MTWDDPINPTAHKAIARLVAGVSPPDATSAVEPVEERHDEHAAGRRAAARAVEALGTAGAVTGARGTRPSWPPGLVGSISHTQGCAAAVVACAARYGAIGLDLEVSGALPAEDAVAVCSAAEKSVLARFARGPERDAVATLHWVAKEAAFKAWDSWCDGALRGVDPALLEVGIVASGAVHVQPAAQLADRRFALPPLSGLWRHRCGLVAVVLAAPARAALRQTGVEGASGAET